MIAKTIRTCFPIAAAAVSEKAEEINKLNVFPVPDGDTGTNMSLTLASVTKELSALPADADMEAIAGAITHGSLMGARGNSGVITSQILRGVAEGLVSADEPITSANIAFAFRRAVKVAFQAVRKPIEGTILTVLRDVSTKADECEKKKFSAEDALDAIVVEAYQSVARTMLARHAARSARNVVFGRFGQHLEFFQHGRFHGGKISLFFEKHRSPGPQFSAVDPMSLCAWRIKKRDGMHRLVRMGRGENSPKIVLCRTRLESPSAAAAVTAAAAAAETARRTLLAGTGLVHGDRLPLEAGTVELFHRFPSLVVVGHFDKAETARTTRFPVSDDVGRSDFAKLCE